MPIGYYSNVYLLIRVVIVDYWPIVSAQPIITLPSPLSLAALWRFSAHAQRLYLALHSILHTHLTYLDNTLILLCVAALTLFRSLQSVLLSSVRYYCGV